MQQGPFHLLLSVPTFLYSLVPLLCPAVTVALIHTALGQMSRGALTPRATSEAWFLHNPSTSWCPSHQISCRSLTPFSTPSQCLVLSFHGNFFQLTGWTISYLFSKIKLKPSCLPGKVDMGTQLINIQVQPSIQHQAVTQIRTEANFRKL